MTQYTIHVDEDSEFVIVPSDHPDITNIQHTGDLNYWLYKSSFTLAGHCHDINIETNSRTLFKEDTIEDFDEYYTLCETVCERLDIDLSDGVTKKYINEEQYKMILEFIDQLNKSRLL